MTVLALFKRSSQLLLARLPVLLCIVHDSGSQCFVNLSPLEASYQGIRHPFCQKCTQKSASKCSLKAAIWVHEPNLSPKFHGWFGLAMLIYPAVPELIRTTAPITPRWNEIHFVRKFVAS